MIQGIFFDAADVFYRRDESTSAFAARLLAEGGFRTRIAPEQERQLAELHGRASRGAIGHEEFWREYLLAHGVTSGERQASMAAQIAEQTMVIRPIAGAHETVRDLKGRGFIIGIVTDTIYPLSWKMKWLEQAGVAEFVDVVACSSEAGLKKPDPAIYMNAVSRAGLTAAKSAFVGHDAGELAGARRAGLCTIAVLYEPDAKADFYAETLADLLQVPILQRAQAQADG